MDALDRELPWWTVMGWDLSDAEDQARIVRLYALRHRVRAGLVNEETPESKRQAFFGWLVDHGRLSDGAGQSAPLPLRSNPDPPDRPPWTWTGYPPAWATKDG